MLSVNDNLCKPDRHIIKISVGKVSAHHNQIDRPHNLEVYEE